jgi:glycine oxidase
MKLGRFWPDQLTAAERAALQPGVHEALNFRPDVLVVGGGVVGITAALACERAGLGSVVLIERDQLGAGATGGAGGLLGADTLRASYPEPYVELAHKSVAIWWELQETWPDGVGITAYDSIKLEPLDPALIATMPASATWVTPDEIRALAPGLVFAGAGVRVPHQARMNPLRAVSNLSRGLGSVSTGVAALGVTVRGGRVTSVQTTAGEISPGAVIFATGMPPQLPGLPLDLPASSIKGHILTTVPPPFRLGAGFAPFATQVDGDGLLSGGTVDTGDDTPDVKPETITQIMADLAVAFPSLDGLAVSHAWVCFRPIHPDDLPVIDLVPSLSNAWISSGHFRHGITLAPASGRAVSDWIATGQRPDEVATFSAGRFASA